MSALGASLSQPLGAECRLPQSPTSPTLLPYIRGFPCHPRGIRRFAYPVRVHSGPMFRVSYTQRLRVTRSLFPNQLLRQRAKNQKIEEVKKSFQSLTGYSPVIKSKPVCRRVAPKEKEYGQKAKNQKIEGLRKSFQSLTGFSPVIRSRTAWSLQDANTAASFEKEYIASLKDNVVRLEFKDLRPSKEQLLSLHPNIREVITYRPDVRFCDIRVKSDPDPRPFLTDVCNLLIKFNPRYSPSSVVNITREEIMSEDIDPKTIFIGNISPTVKTSFFNKLFPNKIGLDLGRSMKNGKTRYAFVRFNTPKEAIEAFKKVNSMNIEGQDLTVRFKRLRVKRSWNNLGESDTPFESENEEDCFFESSQDFLSDWSDDAAEVFYSSDEESCWYDPEEFELEYDQEVQQPPHRSPNEDVLRFLYENEAKFPDYDSQPNEPILPENVDSVQLTNTMLDLNTPPE